MLALILYGMDQELSGTAPAAGRSCHAWQRGDGDWVDWSIEPAVLRMTALFYAFLHVVHACTLCAPQWVPWHDKSRHPVWAKPPCHPRTV
jgi:hypothetical protein